MGAHRTLFWFVLVTMAAFAGGWLALSAARPRPAGPVHVSGVEMVLPAPSMQRFLPIPPMQTPTRVDIYGNDVSRALATYGVDERGGMFEVHSPNTEVPRLGPPKM